MTDDDLRRLEELRAGATPGGAEVDGGSDACLVFGTHPDGPPRLADTSWDEDEGTAAANAAYIAAAWDAVPELVAEVRRLREALREVDAANPGPCEYRGRYCLTHNDKRPCWTEAVRAALEGNP